MTMRTLFRLSPHFTVRDARAADSPASSGDKMTDRARTLVLTQEIAELQNCFSAARSHKLLIILQGMDTAGKDGVIRSVFGPLSALGMRSVAFKTPSLAEREHDFLWRIHSQVPARGEMVLFNRSHYEDVLIARVHGWIDAEQCKRRYVHIRDFERMLADTGTVVLKFFLHLSKDEQKRRFEERLRNPVKQWKFDPADLAERAFWPAYQRAYTRALQETDAGHAPWYVIPSDSKTQRNLAIAAIVAETLHHLNLTFPGLPAQYQDMQIV